MKKAQAMQAVAAMLEENQNQRITPTLTTGIMVLLNQMLPDDPPEAAAKKPRKTRKAPAATGEAAPQ